VSDGVRTRDPQDHNLVLYQLSYAHHRRRAGTRPKQYARCPDGHRAADTSIAVPAFLTNRPDGSGTFYFTGGRFPYRAAIALAVAESGPGCGTNTASR
jgi:hypothetical protein